MNLFTGIGNLTSDPSIKISDKGLKVCSFRIAINSGYKEHRRTDYFHVVAFGKLAENCERFLAKGRKVAVQGPIRTDSYENRDGKRIYTTDIYANEVEFLPNSNGTTQGAEPVQETIMPPGFTEVAADAELPF